MSIDYGMGKTNIDKETGIRYGFIYANNVSDFAIDEIVQEGDDLSYRSWRKELTESLEEAIKCAIENYGHYEKDMVDIDSIVSQVEYQGEGGTYEYSKDGINLSFDTDDSGIFILKSDYYTLCSLCSPCAPGAGFITEEGSYKAYCLPPDWFDDINKMPYRCFRVDNNEEVFQTP